MARQITAPLTKEAAASLRAGGESVLLSGTVYTARDAAHKRAVRPGGGRGSPLPFPIQGAVIYFVGPTPARPGAGHRLRRAHHQLPHGRLLPHPAAAGAVGHDRQGQAGGRRSSRP